MDKHPGIRTRIASRTPKRPLEAADGTASPPRNRPGAAAPSRRCRPLAALWLVAALPGLAVAAPSPEYGPEAEARFLDRCADGEASVRSCRRLMEQLQEQLGYAVFVELASGGPEGFGRTGAEQRTAAATPALGAAGGR